MASSKARSRNRPSSGKGGRSAAGTGSGNKSSSVKDSGARTVPAVSATSIAPATAKPATRPAASARPAAQTAPAEPDIALRTGPPFWLQIVSLVLAVLGLAVSAYETYAHYNGSHLLGCSSKPGTFDCTAVITSSQSMVFGAVPVAVLGLLFYVFAVAIFSPWAWSFNRLEVRLGRRTLRLWRRQVDVLRLVSVVVGMGFVMYLIYAELYQIGQVCEYCSGVHIITFLLFCITVFSAAIWGLGERKATAALR
jgi:uncharacterized membrane protein